MAYQPMMVTYCQVLFNINHLFAHTHTSKGFQLLLFNMSNSIYQVFLSNTNNLYKTAWFQITNNNC